MSFSNWGLEAEIRVTDADTRPYFAWAARLSAASIYDTARGLSLAIPGALRQKKTRGSRGHQTRLHDPPAPCTPDSSTVSNIAQLFIHGRMAPYLLGASPKSESSDRQSAPKNNESLNNLWGPWLERFAKAAVDPAMSRQARADAGAAVGAMESAMADR